MAGERILVVDDETTITCSLAASRACSPGGSRSMRRCSSRSSRTARPRCGRSAGARLSGGARWRSASRSGSTRRPRSLLPSLLAIRASGSGGCRGRGAWRAAAASLLVAGAPLAVFLAVQPAVAGSASALDALARVREVLGLSGEPSATRWWVRGRGGEPSNGTDVVWLSRAHLKYLSNSFHLLLPVCLPALGLLLWRSPRALISGAQGRLLAIAAVPLGVYATAVRPFWGPWDWDLFALTALVLLPCDSANRA